MSRPQPVLIGAAVTAAVPAAVGLAVALGVLTPESASAVEAGLIQAVGALVTIVTLGIAAASAITTRAQVTPVTSPVSADGAPLVPAPSGATVGMRVYQTPSE